MRQWCALWCLLAAAAGVFGKRSRVIPAARPLPLIPPKVISPTRVAPQPNKASLGRAVPSVAGTLTPGIIPSRTGLHRLMTAATPDLEGVELKDVTMFSKDAPFRAAFKSMTAISTTEAGTTYNVVLSTTNSEQNFRFLEGQVLALYVNYKEPDEKPNMMFLTIASSRYGDDETGTSLTLCVLVKAGRENFFGGLEPGAEVMLTGPMGKAMLLPSDLSKDLVLISVGTGIAPYRAFAKRLFVDSSPAKAASTGKVTVITTAEKQEDLVYAAEFESIATGSGGRFVYDTSVGDSILEKIDASGATIVDCLTAGGHVYIAGPLKAIMDDVLAALKKASGDADELIATAKKEGRWHAEVY